MDFISVRVTTDDRDLAIGIFKGCCCVIAEEFLKDDVQHYHAVVHGLGHEQYENIGKRLQRAKLGCSKSWS
jgi:hypothetical protein